MPDLTISVTVAQATRIKAALDAHYVGTALASATVAVQADDYFMSALRQLVRSYETAQARKQAEDGVSEL